MLPPVVIYRGEEVNINEDIKIAAKVNEGRENPVITRAAAKVREYSIIICYKFHFPKSVKAAPLPQLA